MARRRQTRISRLGVAYVLVMAAILGGAVYRQINLLMLIGSVMAGPLLFSLCYGRFALGRLRVERKLPPSLRGDERLAVEVSVTNARRWWGVWTIQVTDTIVREATPALESTATSVGVFFPQVAARETKRLFYEGRLPQRGRYHFGPLRVSTRFPLGLVRHSLLLARPNSLLVHPRLGRLTHDWADVVHENQRGAQRMQRRGLLEADFFGLRDWRSGDSRRWIHWRTTARRGSLVVRQYEQRRSQDLCLLVDLWHSGQPSELERERVELAVSFAATILAEACRQQGRRLTLCVAGEPSLLRSGTAAAYFFREQMDSLALVAAHQHHDFPAQLGHVLALVPSSTPTLMVSTRAIDRTAFERAAAERNVELATRAVQLIEVGTSELTRHFQAARD